MTEPARRTPRPEPSHGPRRAELGAALLVTMIMVFVISLAGVSAMRGSTLERRMATNAIQAREVFQEAESGTEAALNDTDNLTAAFTGGAVELELELSRPEIIDTRATLEYVGAGIAPGYSAGVFEALRFIVSGSSEASSVAASASVEQGAFRTVPAR